MLILMDHLYPPLHKVFGCMLWYQGGGNGLCYMFLPHGLPLIIHPNLISLWITLAFLCDNWSVGRVLCAITFVIFINGYSFLLIHFFAISQVCITKIIFSFLQMYYICVNFQKHIITVKLRSRWCCSLTICLSFVSVYP